MLEATPLQKNRLKSAKNVIFSLLWILVQRPMGGRLNSPTPPLRTPLLLPISGRVDRASATKSVDPGSIPGRVKPKTIKNGIHSFSA